MPLDGISIFEVFVITVPRVVIRIHVRFHGHDGPSATQRVVVLDGDDGLFGDTKDGGIGGFVALTVTASRSWGVNESHFHRERIVRCKLFIGIEFGREGLEVRIQTGASLSEFTHGESGGLKSVRESVGLHGEMDGGMRCEGVIVGNLTFDGASKGIGDFKSEILPVGGVAMLLNGGIEALSVGDIFPIPTSA